MRRGAFERAIAEDIMRLIIGFAALAIVGSAHAQTVTVVCKPSRTHWGSAGLQNTTAAEKNDPANWVTISYDIERQKGCKVVNGKCAWVNETFEMKGDAVTFKAPSPKKYALQDEIRFVPDVGPFENRAYIMGVSASSSGWAGDCAKADKVVPIP
jgi:hypothetical protein